MRNKGKWAADLASDAETAHIAPVDTRTDDLAAALFAAVASDLPKQCDFDGPDPTQGGQHSYAHERQAMSQGTVKWFNATKGFGFIKPDDGTADAFVHISAVERAGLAHLVEGQKIEFDMVQDRRGKMSAENLKPVG
jgi:CspA family cold shock protein